MTETVLPDLYWISIVENRNHSVCNYTVGLLSRLQQFASYVCGIHRSSDLTVPNVALLH